MWPAFEWRTSELMCGSYCTHTDAQSRQGSVTVMSESRSKLAAVICLCGLMVTHLTSFPRSNLLKGGTVPFQKT
jgi:hypothetical protein